MRLSFTLPVIFVCSTSVALGGSLAPAPKVPTTTLYAAPQPAVAAGNCRNAGGQLVPCTVQAPAAPIIQPAPSTAKGVLNQIGSAPHAVIPNSAPQSSYTYSQTSYGTVQVYQNGKLITTATPQFAAQQYGYTGPTTPMQAPVSTIPPPTVKPINPISTNVNVPINTRSSIGAVNAPKPNPTPVSTQKPAIIPAKQPTVYSATPSTKTSPMNNGLSQTAKPAIPASSTNIAVTTPTNIAQPGQQTIASAAWAGVGNAGATVGNAAMATGASVWNGTKWVSGGLSKVETSVPGQIVVDTAAAGGSAFATGGLVTLGKVSDKAALGSAYQSGGTAGLTQQIVEQGFVSGSAKIGDATAGPVGAAAAGATATASWEVGAAIAPYTHLSDGIFWTDQHLLGGKLLSGGNVPH